jgi:ribosome-binding protein aMBF1 (putative translation factor)
LVCDLCGRKTDKLNYVTYDNKNYWVCLNCYFAYDEKQHMGQIQRNFVHENLKNNWQQFHKRSTSFEKELELIKTANKNFRNVTKKPFSILRKYEKCESCGRYVEKTKMTFFYSACFICRDCWRRFIDHVAELSNKGEQWACSYCKQIFFNYEQYYEHHFDSTHLAS